FQRPSDFDPREYAGRVPWQLGETLGTAEIEISEDIAWYVERQYGAYGTLEPAEDGRRIYRTDYAIPRLLISWALDFRGRIAGPRELVEEAARRVESLIEAHRGEPEPLRTTPPRLIAELETNGRSRGSEAAIRPERFARLVTLATVLIAAGRAN